MKEDIMREEEFAMYKQEELKAFYDDEHGTDAERKRAFHALPLKERKEAIAELIEIYLDDNYRERCHQCDEVIYSCDPVVVKDEDKFFCNESCRKECFDDWYATLSPSERKRYHDQNKEWERD